MPRKQSERGLMSFKDIPTQTLGYSVFLSTWDDGTLIIGVGGPKRRQSALMTKEQVYELTRTLQSLQTEL